LESEASATLHAHYLDRLGREQRMTATFTQDAHRVVECAEVLRASFEQTINQVGGTLLAVQLELSDERVLVCESGGRAEGEVVQLRPRSAAIPVGSIVKMAAALMLLTLEPELAGFVYG
jgi:hypothetical protein